MPADASGDQDPTPPLSDEEKSDALTAMLERHAAQLGEHFSSVQIIATEHTHDGTRRHAAGNGDYYARMGAAKSWLDAQSIEP